MFKARDSLLLSNQPIEPCCLFITKFITSRTDNLFGIQGLRWYAKRLRIDEDGDVAHEFLEEVLPEVSSITEGHKRQFPNFQLHYSTQPARVKEQIMALDGRIQHCVEHQGRLQWI